MQSRDGQLPSWARQNTGRKDGAKLAQLLAEPKVISLGNLRNLRYPGDAQRSTSAMKPHGAAGGLR